MQTKMRMVTKISFNDMDKLRKTDLQKKKCAKFYLNNNLEDQLYNCNVQILRKICFNAYSKFSLIFLQSQKLSNLFL